MNELSKLFDSSIRKTNIKIDEEMSFHTSFKTGGKADIFISPESSEEIKSALSICKKESIPYYVIGNGSNLLVSDSGFRGVIISLGEKFSNIEVNCEVIKVQAGALLSKIAAEAKKNVLSGFEFASGIPGSFGGAVCMNAGAYGDEIKNVIKNVTLLSEKGEIISNETAESLELSYRHSNIEERNLTVIEGEISLKPGNIEEIEGRMTELSRARRDKQPLEYPSAGSTFKRPEGNFAGKLISDCGLKGLTVGGAQVSEKHAGFIINRGGASSNDIFELINLVSEKVFEETGVRLEPEVKFIGEF